MVDVDFGRTAEDYRKFREGFPAEMFVRLEQFQIGLPNQTVLDVGTGTGNLARAFASRGCEVTGLDPSPRMLGIARKIDEDDATKIKYVQATAVRTGLANAVFDGVSAGQCWHWTKGAKAAREMRRVLKPGGWLVIAHFDWIPLPENVVEATEELINKYNSEWELGGGSGLYPSSLRDMRATGFTDIETFSFDLSLRFSHEAWRGRVRASSGVAASLAPDLVSRFDVKLKTMLLDRFPHEPLVVPHCCWALVCRSPSAEAAS